MTAHVSSPFSNLAAASPADPQDSSVRSADAQLSEKELLRLSPPTTPAGSSPRQVMSHREIQLPLGCDHRNQHSRQSLDRWSLRRPKWALSPRSLSASVFAAQSCWCRSGQPQTGRLSPEHQLPSSGKTWWGLRSRAPRLAGLAEVKKRSARVGGSTSKDSARCTFTSAQNPKQTPKDRSFTGFST